MKLQLTTRLEVCNGDILVLNLHPNLYYMFTEKWNDLKDLTDEDIENTPFYNEVMQVANAGNNISVEYVITNTKDKGLVFTIPYKELTRLTKDYGVKTIFLDNSLVFGSAS